MMTVTLSKEQLTIAMSMGENTQADEVALKIVSSTATEVTAKGTGKDGETSEVTFTFAEDGKSVVLSKSGEADKLHLVKKASK